MPKTVVEESKDQEPVDKDGSNEAAKAVAVSARAKTGDGKNAGGRELEARQSKAQIREKIYDDMSSVRPNPTPDAPSQFWFDDPLTGESYLVDTTGKQVGNGYASASSALEAGDVAPKDSPREQINLNNAEAGALDPVDGEVIRATARSGAMERLQVEDAEAKADKKRADEAKKLRMKKIAKLLAAALTIGAVVYTAEVAAVMKAVGALPGTGPKVKDASLEGLDPKKAMDLDVGALVLATPNDPLADVTDVNLVAHDDGNPLRVTRAGFGTFDLELDANKARTGKLRFTPEAAFNGGDVAVVVTIGDKVHNASYPAAITLKFLTGAKGPKVKSSEQVNLDPSKDQTLDVPALILATMNDPTADKTSLKLAKPDPDSKLRLTVPAAGLFELTVDTTGKPTGQMVFRPLTQYLGGTAPEASVTISSTSGDASETATVKLSFDRRAQAGTLFIQADVTQVNAITFNPITAVGVDMGQAAIKGSYDIDPATVFLSLPVAMEGAEPQKGDITITGGKTAVAKGEGVWTVDSKTGDVTFTRDAAFRGDPTPLAWWVADTKKIPSTLGTMTLSSHLQTVISTIKALNTMDDAAFWKNYEDNLVNTDFGSIQTANDIVAILTLFRTLHTVVTSVTRTSLSDTDVEGAIYNARPTTAALNAAYMAWAKAGLTRTELYNQGKTMTPTPNPAVDNITNGARFRFLDNITRLLGKWQNAMDAIPPSGGGS